MKLKPNKPKNGMGMYGTPKQMKPLNASASMPMRLNSGYDDAKGYQSTEDRRNGKQTGGLMSGDSNKSKVGTGNAKGTPPPKLGKVSKATMNKQIGRGYGGRTGGADQNKGKAKSLPESISHSAFEKLGA